MRNPFRIYKIQQMAIGELLIVAEDDEHFSMGYAAFRNAYEANQPLTPLFPALIELLSR